jgi:type VI secretion system secreted protein Hcp
MKMPRNLMRPFLWTFLACSIFASAHAASVDYFLQIDGVEGESQDDKHKNQIEILSYSWGAQAVIDPLTGAGKFVRSDFQIPKLLDKSSPKLAQACANGTHFPKATLTMRKSGGVQIEFVRYIFEDILVTGHTVAGDVNGDRPAEIVSLNFAKVGIEYFTIAPLGTIDARDAFAWDFVLNGAATLAFPSSIDADGDTIPDDWERAFLLDSTIDDAGLDKDNDGASNKEEYIAGTDPSSSDKVFRASLNFTAGARTASLTWPSAPDKNYQILIGLNLDDPFQPYMVVPSSGEATTTVNLPATAINQFFRVEIVP